MGVDGQRHAPAAVPTDKTRYLLQSLGEPQDRSGQVWKISLPPGFDPTIILVYCVREHIRNIPSAVGMAPPEDEQVMLETCRGPYFFIN
jgi:hypothetical protein